MSKGGGVAEREKDKQKEKEKKKNRNEKNYDTRKIKKNEIEGREGVREGKGKKERGSKLGRKKSTEREWEGRLE